ncbi:phosphoglucosamine mutase [Candidatus Bathyarchaeota archaeon]|nr:phosphoglucosamine mutase [Candidatus Bathyarchaeota archaeon]
MTKLFGTNGVRGVVNQELTVEMVTRLSSCIGNTLGKELAIGRDGRISSQMFYNAAVSGLLSVGCNVHDFGLLPTPTLQYCIKHLNLDGGLMITASHNPPQFNGVKVVAGDGVEIPRSVEEVIEEMYFSKEPKLVSWDKIGKKYSRDVIDIYINEVVSKVDYKKIKEKKFKIALDPGNGVASIVAPLIAQKLGCTIYTINSDIDGTFPGRESEPRPDNLSNLQELVKTTGSDLGVAFDGDGDRSIFLDENGEILYGDRSFALTAKDFLNRYPGSKVVTSVSSSNAIVEVVEKAGGSIYWTKVGSVDISRAMVENGIMFGGEENGGVMYGLHNPVRDGSMTMALILWIMANEGQSLSNLVSQLPQYAQLKDRVKCPNNIKEQVLKLLEKKVKAPKIDTMDGLKLFYPDGSWILIRPSGTEPIYRIYAESDTLEKVTKLVEENKNLIEETIKQLVS